MRVLIGCEHSGVVRRAFRARGHDAWSCDLLAAVDGGEHLQCDVLTVLDRGWDMAIFHPDCTYLTLAAEWAYTDGPYHMELEPETLVGAARREARRLAVEFARKLMAAPIKRKAMENPMSHLSTAYRRPDQTIQPNQFGDDASKATCLWLENLPPLRRTRQVLPRLVTHAGRTVQRWANQTDSGQNNLSPSEDRWARRAETYPGIAMAFADQWGSLPADWAPAQASFFDRLAVE